MTKLPRLPPGITGPLGTETSSLLALGLEASSSAGLSPRGIAGAAAVVAAAAVCRGLGAVDFAGADAPAGKLGADCSHRRRRCCPGKAATPGGNVCALSATALRGCSALRMPHLLRGSAGGTASSALFLQSAGASSQLLRLVLVLSWFPVLFLQSTGLPAALGALVFRHRLPHADG